MIEKLHHKPFVFKDFSEKAPLRQNNAQHPAEQTQPEPIPQEPVAPSFSEEELQAARREAEEIGRKKGYQDAKREWDEVTLAHEAQLITLLESLTARLNGEIAGQEKLRNSQRADLANIVLMIARKLVGNAVDNQPISTIEPMIKECLLMLTGEAKLAITVNLELKEPLTKYLAAMQREGQVIDIIADEHMHIGDCRIQWPGGKAERSQEALWKEMEQIVMRALVAPTHKSEQPDS